MSRRHKHLLNKTLQGGISTYVFIMLGTSIILYMFGFTNMLGTGLPGGSGYRADSQIVEGNANTSIENPDLQKNQAVNPLKMLLDGVFMFAKENPLILFGGIASLIVASVIGFVAGANMSVLYQYIIPIVFIGIFLNYIVFPVNPATTDLQKMSLASNLTASVALTIFFNLWYILAVISFVRSGET